MEKALSEYVGSPTKSPPKRKAHKPPQKTTFTPLEDAGRMVAEKQKAKKWEPGPNAATTVQKRHTETLLKNMMDSIPGGAVSGKASGKSAGKQPSGRPKKAQEPETKFV